MLDEIAGLQFGHGLAQLFLRVHHDGPYHATGSLDRFTRYQKEANSLIAGLDRDLVAAIEKHQRVMLTS